MLANVVRIGGDRRTVSNIILNGNFTDTSSWTSDQLEYFDFAVANNIGSVSAINTFYQLFALTTNSQYYLSVWIKTATIDNYFYSFTLDGVNSLPYGSLIETSEWQRIILKGTCTVTGTSSFIIGSEDEINFQIRDAVLVNKTADGILHYTDTQMAGLTEKWFDTKAIRRL